MIDLSRKVVPFSCGAGGQGATNPRPFSKLGRIEACCDG